MSGKVSRSSNGLNTDFSNLRLQVRILSGGLEYFGQ